MTLQLGQLPLNSSELSKARRRGQKEEDPGQGCQAASLDRQWQPQDPRQVCSASPTGGAEESWAGQHLYPQYPCAQHLYPVPLCPAPLCPVSPHP